MRALRFGCAVLAVGVLVACGGAIDVPDGRQGTTTSALNAKAVGGTLTSPSPGTIRAPSTAGGACANNVRRQSSTGWLIASPKVYAVYWGAYWTQATGSPSGATEKSQYDAAWSLLASSPGFYNRLREYGIGVGTFFGSKTTNASLPAGTVNESQVQSTLMSEISAGTLPPASPSNIYAIFLPPNVTDTFDTTNNFAGHHNFVTVGTTNTAYAVIEYSADHNYNDPLLSHEVMEASTNPDLSSGYWDTSTGQEIGDICRFQYLGMAGQKVERIWSQARCACVSRREASTADYNGDWMADLAATGTSSKLSSSQVAVALASGQGSFGATAASTSDFNSFATAAGAIVVPGDFDGNGTTDLAAVGVASWGGIKIAYSNGDGTFAPTSTVSTSFGTAASAVGAKVVASDVDGDGRTDLVATSGTSVSVAFAAAGAFRATTSTSSFASLAAQAGAGLRGGDIDGDGRDDLVAVGGSATTIPVAFSNGDGTFRVTNLTSSFATSASQMGAKVVVGDVDNDTLLDLLETGTPGATGITVGRSNGDGTFGATSVSNGFASLAGQTGAVVAGGDYSGDGQYDVAATGVSSWTTVPVALSTGAASFSFVNAASDFAAYAAGTAIRVVGAVGYGDSVGAPLSRSGWTATASSSAGGDVPANALDGNLSTRWSTGAAQSNGQTFQVDMKTSNTFARITLDAATSTGDYARGYQVFVSSDGVNFGSAVASGSGSSQLISIAFAPQTARYIKVLQTGSASAWWSIHELNVYGASAPPPQALPRTGWVAMASPSSSIDVPANALDGNLSTRWSTGTAQANGQQFQVDMKAQQTFAQVTLDAGTSSGDYPRGYQIFVSSDGVNFGASIASGSGSSQLVTVVFAQQTARYVRVAQTGTAGSWWSIHEFNVWN